VAFGYQYADLFLEVNGHDARSLSAPSALIGFAIPLPLGGFLARRLAIANGFVIPQRSVLLADLPRPSTPQFAVVGNRAQTVSLQGSIALRVVDEFSVGAGFLALAKLAGDVAVAPNEAGRIGSKVGDELLADYAPVFGALLKPGGDVAVGFVYHGESRATFSLPITADLGPKFPLPVPTLDITGTAQYDPAQATLEVSGRPPLGDDRPLLIAAGVTRKDWSEFPVPVVFTAVPEDYPAQPAPHFHDTWVWRAGAELTLDAGPLTVQPRAGYAFEGTPVPEQHGYHNFLDSDRHIVAAGVGLRYGPLNLDLAGQWHHMVARTHHKDAALLEPFGDPSINAGYPSIRHQGDLMALSVELGLTL
jgi:long-subunit fatty acid transport protein